MSGVEIALPVIAAVIALVSAFKDGGNIAKQLKERRQLRGAKPPNERLHKVLEQGVQEVESSQEEGVEDFGSEFQVDVVTACKLKDVTIVLQDAIIKELAAAYQNDDMDDFTPAINAIIKARREAVGILNGHYLDLQKRRSQGSSRLHSQPASPNLGTVFEDDQWRNRPQQRLSTNTLDATAWGGFPIAAEHSSHQRRNSGSHTGTQHLESRERVAQSPQMRSKSGLLGIFGRRSSIGKDINLPQQLATSPALSHASSLEQQQRGTAVTLPSSPPASVGLPSPALHRTPTATSTAEQVQRAYKVIPISKENNYAGLCRCAHYAQSYELKKAMEPSMREYEWMYHCRKCKYRLMSDSSQRGSPHFDDRIQISSSTINFRCIFLFKSHMSSRVGETRHYSCLLCLLASCKSRIYVGEDQLFGHVARHAGEVLVMSDGQEVTLQGMIEVQSDGITNATIESFDIYFPLEMQLQNNGSRRLSFPMLPDSAMNNISELDGNMGGQDTLEPGTGSAIFRNRNNQALSEIHLETRQHVPDSSTSLRNEMSTRSNHFLEEPYGHHTNILPLPFTMHTPDRLYELPGANENVWKQDQTKYAELDATRSK